jgi:hypothetical protein
MLLQEVSTLPLTLVNFALFTPFAAAVNQLVFVMLFFLCRIVLTPYMWYEIVSTSYQLRNSELYKSCITRSVLPVSFAIGMFFHCLNAFWMYKILRKLRRKILGIEKITANNELHEPDSKKKD